MITIKDSDITTFNDNFTIYSKSDNQDLILESKCYIINFVVKIRKDLEEGKTIYVPKWDVRFDNKYEFDKWMEIDSYKGRKISELKSDFKTPMEKRKEFLLREIQILRDRITREDKSNPALEKLSDEYIIHYNKKIEEYENELKELEPR